MPGGQQLSGYRFPREVSGYAVWRSYRFTLSSRDGEELLLERGICVTREPIRSWCIKSGDLFAQGSRWHLDDMHVDVGGIVHNGLA